MTRVVTQPARRFVSVDFNFLIHMKLLKYSDKCLVSIFNQRKEISRKLDRVYAQNECRWHRVNMCKKSPEKIWEEEEQCFQLLIWVVHPWALWIHRLWCKSNLLEISIGSYKKVVSKPRVEIQPLTRVLATCCFSNVQTHKTPSWWCVTLTGYLKGFFGR